MARPIPLLSNFHLLFVDDMLISAPDRETIERTKETIRAHFDIKEMGDVQSFISYKSIETGQNGRYFLLRLQTSPSCEKNPVKTSLHSDTSSKLQPQEGLELYH